jgi:hypothetical protein
MTDINNNIKVTNDTIRIRRRTGIPGLDLIRQREKYEDDLKDIREKFGKI